MTATEALTQGQSASETFTVRVTDGSATQTANAVFSITGSNDVVAISVGSASASLVEAGGVSNGTAGTAASAIALTTTDLDNTASFDTAYLVANGWSTGDAGLTYTKAGTYGSASFTIASGLVTYTLNNGLTATEALTQGQSVTETFTVQVVDGAVNQTADAVFNITGSNDVPTVSAGAASAALVEAGGVANGTAGTSASSIALTKGDVDGTASFDTAYLLANGWSTSNAGLSYTKAGTYGTATFTLASGAVAYALNDSLSATQALTQGQSVSETFTIQVTDGTATQTTDAVFSITGSNDVPTITAGAASASLVEAGGVANGTSGTASSSITLSKGDADGTASFDTAYLLANGWSTSNAGVSYTKAGTYGTATLTMASGVVGYILNDSLSATDALTQGQSTSDSFTIQVTDGVATQTTNAVFAISGRNDNPTVTAGAASAALVEAGGVANGTAGTSSSSITMTKGDVDGTASFDTAYLLANGWSTGDSGVSYTRSGTYGTATFTVASGLVSYALNDNLSATEDLTQGQSVTDSFTIQVTDGVAIRTANANFTITGRNDAPTITAGAASATLVEAGGVANGTAGTSASSITLSKGDVDGTASFDTAYLLANGWSTSNAGVSYTKAGTYGTATLTVASGVVGYALNDSLTATEALTQGQSVTDSFTIQVTDSSATRTANADFAITGSNDAPTITAGAASATLVEAGGVANGTAGTAASSITLTKGDVDGTASFDTAYLLANGWSTSNAGISYTKAGTYGTATFTVASGVVGFALDDNLAATEALTQGQSVTDSFTIQVTDGSATRTANADFAITGSNDAPTITAGAASATLVEAGGVANGTAGTSASSITLSKGDVDGTASFDSAYLLANGWSTSNAGVSYTRSGTYGTATFTMASGVVAYALDDNLPATEALIQGQSVTESFTIQVTDGSVTRSVSADFSISGANDTAAPNQLPTLGSFAASVGTVNEDTQATITLDDLLGQADEVDPDGNVDGFVIKAVSSGTLKIGTSAATATVWAAGTNDTVDETHNAYWTPDSDANGTLNAFTAVARDNSAAESVTARQVTMDVTPVNDAPTLTAGAASAALVEAGGVANGTAGTSASSITLTKGDVDGTASFETAYLLANGWSTSNAGVSYTKAGTYGTATFTVASGVVGYALNDSLTATEALTQGQSVTDSFTIQVTDGSATRTANADFAITGRNDAPTVTAGAASATLVEAGGVANGTAGTAASSITLTKGDVDGTASFDTVYLLANGWSTSNAGVSYTKAGTYGTATFTVASGVVGFALDDNLAATEALTQGQSVTDSFTIQVTDGSATRTANADFAITGSNDAPTVTAGAASATLVEAGGVANGTAGTSASSITLSKGDVDGTASFHSAYLLANGWSTSNAGVSYTKAGTYGTATFTVASGVVGYALDDNLPATEALTQGQSVTDSFTIQVTDGNATRTVDAVFSLSGANDAGSGPAPNLLPTLGGFAASLGALNEDTRHTITLSDLLAQGDEADADGTVDAFVIRSVSSGSLSIGTSLATASAWVAGTNDTVDATHQAYWMPDLDANGTLNAFTAVAKDNAGGESATARQATMDVRPVNDAPVITFGAPSANLVEAGGEANGTAGTASSTIQVSIDDADGVASFNTAYLVATGWSTSDGGANYSKAGTYGTMSLALASGTVNYALDDARLATESLTQGQVVEERFSLRVTDGGASQVADAAFTVIGRNDAPTIDAGAASEALVESGGVANGTAGISSSSVSFSLGDVDSVPSFDTAFLLANGWTSLDGGARFARAGSFGMASLNLESGLLTYALDDGLAATDALTQGQNATERFTVQVTDGRASRTAVALFSISGRNDAPTVTAGAASSTLIEAGGAANETAGVASSSIELVKGDVDGAASFDTGYLTANGWTTADGGASFRKSGSYGTATFALASGIVTYALDDGRTATEALGLDQSASESFTIRVTDGSATRIVDAVFDIQGRNDAPVLTQNGLLRLTEAATSVIDDSLLSTNDVDTPDARIVFTLVGLPQKGELLLNGTALALNGRFTQADLNAGRLAYHSIRPGEDSFLFQVSDGSGGRLTSRIFLVQSDPLARSSGTSGAGGTGGERDTGLPEEAGAPPSPPAALPTDLAVVNPDVLGFVALSSPSSGFRSDGDSLAGLFAPERERELEIPSLSEAFSLPLPRAVFQSDDPSASIVVQASLSDGQPLPAWLKFNPATGVFEGRPPAGFAGDLTLRLVARDQRGNTVSIQVKMKAPRPGPQASLDAAPDIQVPLESEAISLELPQEGATVAAQLASGNGRPSLNQQIQSWGRQQDQDRNAGLLAQVHSMIKARANSKDMGRVSST